MSTRRTRFVADLHGIMGDLSRATDELKEQDGDIWHVMSELQDIQERIEAISTQLAVLNAEALRAALDTESA